MVNALDPETSALTMKPPRLSNRSKIKVIVLLLSTLNENRSIDLDEIPGFYLFVKLDFYVARSEDTVFPV